MIEAMMEVRQECSATLSGSLTPARLVEPGTAERWRARDAVECLGYGTRLGVPGMGRDRSAPGRPLYWAAAPGPGSHFCRVAAVRLLVRVGAARLAEPEVAT
ncbi:hypothetical protein ACH4XT_05165 [Streptomyces avidinii]|uniref:hypothetical protein n=1 Tax=Streptomyces avidinii TaxID=1895 RepID=UPI00378EE382